MDLELTNPTQNIKLDFTAYAQQRERQLGRHMVGGVPDYAFSLDARLRATLGSFSVLRNIGQALNAATVPYQRQLMLMNGIAVGPRQFPDIHALGEQCARTLGIGIPQIFVLHDPHPNAWTFCTDDVEQLVVLTSSLIESCNLSQLAFIIGHECGHVHNQHVVYNTIWELLANPLANKVLVAGARAIPGLGALIPLLQLAAKAGVWYAFGRWQRCAEITCDRAGLICNGDATAAQAALGRLETGNAMLLKGFNAEEYAAQMQRINKSPLKLMEVFRSHPLGPKRVLALGLFSDCATLADWQPAAVAAGAELRPQSEVDAECEKLML